MNIIDLIENLIRDAQRAHEDMSGNEEHEQFIKSKHALIDEIYKGDEMLIDPYHRALMQGFDEDGYNNGNADPNTKEVLITMEFVGKYGNLTERGKSYVRRHM